METKRKSQNEAKKDVKKTVESLPNRSKKTPSEGQKNEHSRNVTPPDAGISPKDTLKDAEARWNDESPAQPGQQNPATKDKPKKKPSVKDTETKKSNKKGQS